MPSKKPFALAVDDEPSDLENVRDALANAGYHVLTASDANSAMEIFKRHADQIEILVTDVAMSPVGGCDLAAALVKLKPDLHVTFVSAYSGSSLPVWRGAHLPLRSCRQAVFSARSAGE